jgi:hypothetical protein
MASQLLREGQRVDPLIDRDRALATVFIAIYKRKRPQQKIFLALSLLLLLRATGLKEYYNDLRDAWDEIMDVPSDDEAAPVHRHPVRFTRIDEFPGDDEAQLNTNFNLSQLHQLNGLFGLDEHVRVPIRESGKFYVFHREALLIYTFIKLKKGHTHVDMAHTATGGEPRRWSYGFNYFVKYVDHRYRNLIGPNGMRLWVHHFPQFAEKIRLKIARPTHFRATADAPARVENGLEYPPGEFRVVGFLDCSDFAIARPGSGPYDSGADAQRRAGWYLEQLAYYSGHKKRHALRIMSFLLPNGLTACTYGPVSARRNDLGILNWSRIDQLLHMLLQNMGLPAYKFYGDSAYAMGNYAHIIARNEPGTDDPLTVEEKEQNRVMKKVRERIELYYGQLKSLWRMTGEKEQIKLANDGEHVSAMLRLAFLLTNCKTCFNGNVVNAGISGFGILAPSIETYLRPIDDPPDSFEEWFAECFGPFDDE